MSGPWYMIAVERWYTAGDERVCSACFALAGKEFDEGKGPQPPLHARCRCHRAFDHIRYTQEEPQA